MPESYYSGVGYPYPVEDRYPGGRYYTPSKAGSVAGSTASNAIIRPSYVNSQGQLGIDYPASQISRASASSHVSAARSNAGSYHSLREVEPSDSSSQVGSVVFSVSRTSHISCASNISHASRASTVRPEDSLSQIGGPSASSNHGRRRDLSGHKLALLKPQGGQHAPTVISNFSQATRSQAGSQAGGQVVPYAGSDISTDSTLIIDMRDEIQRQGGNDGGGGKNGDDLNVAVAEADIARGRDMWPGLDRENIKCRMKLVLTREEVQRRIAARSMR